MAASGQDFDMSQDKDPKICRINTTTGSERGGDEIMIFIEKASKEDIKVRFFELAGETRVWCDIAEIQDFHLQCGIAFRLIIFY